MAQKMRRRRKLHRGQVRIGGERSVFNHQKKRPDQNIDDHIALVLDQDHCGPCRLSAALHAGRFRTDVQYVERVPGSRRSVAAHDQSQPMGNVENNLFK